MAKHRRIWILPFSAAVIAGLCAYKLTRSETPADARGPVVLTRQAPLFELYNQQKPPRITRLKSYLGRHRLLLVFFNAEEEWETNPVLVWLCDNAGRLDDQNVKVFAISQALPQTHRQRLKEFLGPDQPAPFLWLSDLLGEVHHLYGLEEPGSQSLDSVVFLTDRAGNLPWNREHPLPLEDPLTTLEQELGGK